EHRNLSVFEKQQGPCQSKPRISQISGEIGDDAPYVKVRTIKWTLHIARQWRAIIGNCKVGEASGPASIATGHFRATKLLQDQWSDRLVPARKFDHHGPVEFRLV